MSFNIQLVMSVLAFDHKHVLFEAQQFLWVCYSMHHLLFSPDMLHSRSFLCTFQSQLLCWVNPIRCWKRTETFLMNDGKTWHTISHWFTTDWDLLLMEIYYWWRFTTDGDLLLMEIYYWWRFTTDGDVLLMDIYYWWRFTTDGDLVLMEI